VLLKNAAIKPDQLDEVTARSVVSFLERSQQNKQSASLASLLEQYAMSTGQVLPQLTDYPTLVVQVEPAKPEDFVVTIDQVSYPAGSTTFRVTEGSKTVRVGRANKVPCDKAIRVTRQGPNLVACSL